MKSELYQYIFCTTRKKSIKVIRVSPLKIVPGLFKPKRCSSSPTSRNACAVRGTALLPCLIKPNRWAPSQGHLYLVLRSAYACGGNRDTTLLPCFIDPNHCAPKHYEPHMHVLVEARHCYLVEGAVADREPTSRGSLPSLLSGPCSSSVSDLFLQLTNFLLVLMSQPFIRTDTYNFKWEQLFLQYNFRHVPKTPIQ